MKSTCCNADVTMNNENSTTRFYVCTECKMGCEPDYKKIVGDLYPRSKKTPVQAAKEALESINNDIVNQDYIERI